jgi:glutathione S-transferase
MRARMALAYANITIELREILLSDRPDELYAISAKATVPVLQLPDGSVIDESFDIMKWALEQSKTDWLDINFEDQLFIIKINDEEFKPWLNKYKYHQRNSVSSYEESQDKCVQILSKYEETLSEKLFLFGEKAQVADVAVLPLVRQFAYVDLSFFMKKLPHLNRWLEIWKTSIIFQSIMKKYDKWEPTQTPLIVTFIHK